MPMPHPVTRVLFLLLALTLLGCGGRNEVPSLPPLAGEARILAFGDSLTRGTGAGNPEASYPAALAHRLTVEVINAGVPGELSAAGADRLPGLLERERPDLLLLCHGGNDLLRNRDEGALRENLRRMVDSARDMDIPVVLIGVPARAWPLRTAGLYRELAEELNVPLVEDAVAGILRDESLRADPIHPNADGYAHLAKAVHALLVETGAVPPP